MRVIISLPTCYWENRLHTSFHVLKVRSQTTFDSFISFFLFFDPSHFYFGFVQYAFMKRNAHTKYKNIKPRWYFPNALPSPSTEHEVLPFLVSSLAIAFALRYNVKDYSESASMRQAGELLPNNRSLNVS